MGSKDKAEAMNTELEASAYSDPKAKRKALEMCSLLPDPEESEKN